MVSITLPSFASQKTTHNFYYIDFLELVIVWMF